MNDNLSRFSSQQASGGSTVDNSISATGVRPVSANDFALAGGSPANSFVASHVPVMPLSGAPLGKPGIEVKKKEFVFDGEDVIMEDLW